MEPIIAKPLDERTEEQVRLLSEFHLLQHDSVYEALATDVQRLEDQRRATEADVPTTLVFRERTEPREAFVLVRGQYDQRGDRVQRRTPSFLPSLADAPPNRLGLARWLIEPATSTSGLTSRVAVNRFWQQLFGRGLVETAEDFGTQGTPPTHPQLLDWLAVEFVASGWDVQALLKEMVMSATYRQSSRVAPNQYARDPENHLLARGPRFRLDAEMLRDQALVVSGLLVDRVGGPSVKPPQPDGLWQAVGYSGSNTVRFVADQGPDKVHRRSLYTFWKRTAPPPQMSTFDAPSRESCSARRERTNSPLQALLLMNDPQYVQAARALGRRALREGGDSDQQRAGWAFRQVTSRPATTTELNELVASCQDFRSAFQADIDSAARLCLGVSGEDSFELVEWATWTMVANLLLNLDEVLTKE